MHFWHTYVAACGTTVWAVLAGWARRADGGRGRVVFELAGHAFKARSTAYRRHLFQRTVLLTSDQPSQEAGAKIGQRCRYKAIKLLHIPEQRYGLPCPSAAAHMIQFSRPAAAPRPHATRCNRALNTNTYRIYIYSIKLRLPWQSVVNL